MDIGSNIKKYRNDRSLTQVELANKANISRSYLADVERNRYNASLETLNSIAVALEVHMSALLGESNEIWDEDTSSKIKALALKSFKDGPIKVNKINKMDSTLDIVPKKFTIADEARSYIGKHTILAADGFDLNKMSDEDVLEFANAILEQIKMVGYKYKK